MMEISIWAFSYEIFSGKVRIILHQDKINSTAVMMFWANH